MSTESYYLGILVRYLNRQKKLTGDLHGAKGGKFSLKAVGERLGFKERHELTNVLNGDSSTNFQTIRDFFEGPVTENFDALPPPLRAMAEEIYRISDTSVRPDISDLILKGTRRDKGEIAEFCDRYTGVYTVWRYAAHLGVEPSKNSDGTYSSWVVRAALEIIPGEEYPSFRIRYKPRSISEVRVISGLILRVGVPGHIYFWGYEEDSGYPLVMVGKHDIGGTGLIQCVVVRKHEDQRVFMARTLLQRMPEGTDIDELNVGMFPETEVADEIANFAEFMENKPYLHVMVGYKGAITL